MDNKNLQEQMEAINRKLDFVMEEVMAQREARQNVVDLTRDLSIIGKDLFSATVVELENAGVEIDGEAVKVLLLKVIRNIDKLNELFDILESAFDFIKDVSPILHQIGLDGVKMVADLEEKGYVDFAKEGIRIVENIMEHFSAEDVRLLADNIVFILETVKNITQPDMLDTINNGVVVYKSLDVNDIPEYSIWKAMRAMNRPEMKKGLGFIITFLTNIAQSDSKSNK